MERQGQSKSIHMCKSKYEHNIHISVILYTIYNMQIYNINMRYSV